MGRHVDIAALVRRADAAAADGRALGALVRRCWSRASDATNPVARDWVSRWGPVRLTASPVECGCAAGRCACRN